MLTPPVTKHFLRDSVGIGVKTLGIPLEICSRGGDSASDWLFNHGSTEVISQPSLR